MVILVVGSGGREHALAWACSRRGDVEIVCAPGNAGTAAIGENVDVDPTNAVAVADLAVARSADLVVVGPDAALAAGVVDACQSRGIAVFGPTAAAAQIETSKAFAKSVMGAAGIPTAAWVEATAANRGAALEFIRARSGHCVVKADGLAAGKGVVVAATAADAEAALSRCLDDQAFGGAGTRVVVEERFDGREVSVFALCDGENARLLPLACDYKRAYDGDAGPNTGGMGAYTPPMDLDGPALLEWTRSEVIGPCLAELRSRGLPFRGCLYVGLMLTTSGTMVLEFNARFGDPETQALLPILDEDFVELLMAAATGHVTPGVVATRSAASVCVVATTDQYPGEGPLGMDLTLAPVTEEQGLIFLAGAQQKDGRATVTGGRVANAVGWGPDLNSARSRAYSLVDTIQFAGVRHRRDIGLALQRVPPVEETSDV